MVEAVALVAGQHEADRQVTRYSKETYVCDRKGCGAVYERIVVEGHYGLPTGWTEHGKNTHYCSNHRVVVTVLDVVGEKGEWVEEK